MHPPTLTESEPLPAVMCDDDRGAPHTGGESPSGSDGQMETAGTTSPSASSNAPSAASTPDHLTNGLTAGPRLHPLHGDRPTSAPPHHLEHLSAAILRTMGDQYQSSTYGRTLRMIGDQITFENEIRRVLSYSDLDRLQRNENR